MALKLASDSEDLAVAHEINVTPFIDVMLVLLIIFMVAAPLATVDVKVDLPVSNAQAAPKPEAPVYLSMQADGALSVGDDRVTLATLGDAIVGATAGDREKRIFLRADKTVTYDAIMQAMNALRGEGYVHVALVGAETGAARP
ncbi:TonB system transport protein ExbD [Croceicoccus mobilis]|uniref:Biopolymer transport protein ExbD n=1 Tax=Croceicoccus mobilis TaxID=1703339 RepID=A0A916Z7Y0_9SPHN|nr:TonB system transport protein ExbD [Croceicoccus mobilis]GGD78707.1 TonB system transport protein ExbD [Croceicoccus mobilis]